MYLSTTTTLYGLLLIAAPVLLLIESIIVQFILQVSIGFVFTWKNLLYVFVPQWVLSWMFLIPTLLFKPFNINHFFLRAFLEILLDDFMVLSLLRIPETVGLHFHASRLNDMSKEARIYQLNKAQNSLTILKRFRNINPEVSKKILEFCLETMEQGARLGAYVYPLYATSVYPCNPTNGVQNTLVEFLLNQHQIKNTRDARDFVKRVQATKSFIEQLIEDMKEKQQKQMIPPDFILEKVLQNISKLMDIQDIHEFVLYKHLVTKLDQIKASSADRQKLLSELLQACETIFIPAYRSLRAYVTELKKVSSSDAGVWKFQNGTEVYNYFVRRETSTDLSAEAIHELGLREVKRIQQEITAILHKEGYPVDPENLGKTFDQIRTESRFYYPDTPEGRIDIKRDYEKILEDVEPKLEHLFDIKPAVGIKIERVHSFKEGSAPPAYYFPPPLDRSDKGTFFVNLRDVFSHPTYFMKDLAYHEGIPGHHYQLVIAQDQKSLPLFRRNLPFTAYAEGWGLYAERIADEEGWYENSFERLGFLTAELWRAVRLVVDTGMHRKRWSRQQAAKYMKDNTALAQSDVDTEIDRYIVLPGQALSYKVGQLKILELREYARAKLGPAFDIKKFHNTVLLNGSMPLTILEQVIHQWVDEQMG